jgi:hypothetical protein
VVGGELEAFELLEEEDVGLLVGEEGFDEREAGAEGVDVPGGEFDGGGSLAWVQYRIGAGVLLGRRLTTDDTEKHGFGLWRCAGLGLGWVWRGWNALGREPRGWE